MLIVLGKERAFYKKRMMVSNGDNLVVPSSTRELLANTEKNTGRGEANENEKEESEESKDSILFNPSDFDL